MSLKDGASSGPAGAWYDLFSRGTRDWLRHNEKVREAVRDKLPDLVAEMDVLSRPENRSVRVPVRFMEHYRFRLRDTEEEQGVGQGKVQPGDVLRRARQAQTGGGEGGAGEGDGSISFVLEFQIDEVLDWLWEELRLPNLQPREGTEIRDDSYVREGIDKRGAPSRLDRRRTLKEAIKRRHAAPQSEVPVSSEDLRFRQLARRPRPATSAVIFFLLDVSSSMDDHCRKLAKTFFFWALQGIRRQFAALETVFIAHTEAAWEFEEKDFFKVQGEGGTRSSSGLRMVADILEERFDPARYNCYLFYATDGHNFREDRDQTMTQLARLAPAMNFMGYTQVARHSYPYPDQDTELHEIWEEGEAEGWAMGSYPLSDETDILPAIKAFFRTQAGTEREAS